MPTRKIKKIFIANRGEIARRIGWSAKLLGIETATIKTSIVPPKFLCSVIDDFVEVANATAKDYLNAAQVLRLAKELGCDSIHPGFGFLSENADFAAQVEAANLVWIGPNPKAMEKMASKANAFTIAQANDVPCNIGIRNLDIIGDKNAYASARKFAEKIGPPLLIKAALGGGGKGMRLVEDLAKLDEALQRCNSEAISFFADGRLILEKYLAAPRHIEVQVLADKHGNVAIVGDRDCSVQRRHQKIIEEAPAIFKYEKTREAIHTASKKLAKAVSYDSAGTVEFLIDTQSKKEDFYFLEMNTRLQVEHTVSEEVFGLDLVQWQIRIAEGDKCPAIDPLAHQSRHSIEIRLYGENPEQQFFPSPGKIHYFAPYFAPGVRWEIGIDSMDEVNANFDPMLAKCITTGENRQQAIHKMRLALKNTLFFGPKNNLEYLVAIFEDNDFAEHRFHTHFINEHHVKLLQKINSEREKLEGAVHTIMAFLADGNLQHSRPAFGVNDHVQITQLAFCQNSPSVKTSPRTDTTIVDLDYHQSSSTYSQGAKAQHLLGHGRIAVDRHSPRHFSFLYTLENPNTKSLYLHMDGKVFKQVKTEKILEKETIGDAMENAIIAPVPGKVVAVKGQVSEMVEVNATVAIIESMKMEYEVKTNRSGKISELKIKKGDQVKAGDILAVLHEA